MTTNFWSRRSRIARLSVNALVGAGCIGLVALAAAFMAEALVDSDCEEEAQVRFEKINRDVLVLAFQPATFETSSVSQCDSAGTPYVEWAVRGSPHQEMAPFASGGWVKVSDLSPNGRVPLAYEQKLDGNLYHVSSTNRFVRASVVTLEGE